jgi:hypothetical protein
MIDDFYDGWEMCTAFWALFGWFDLGGCSALRFGFSFS